MKKFLISPLDMISGVWLNRSLIVTLTMREFTGRYRGSLFGFLWSLLHPVFMLTVYTFVFSVIFKARWSYESDSKVEFALVLFAGLIVFNLFSECVTRAPNLILSNTSYVKKVVFPLEILPCVVIGSALIHFCINMLIWLAAYTLLVGVPHVTTFLLPFVLLPLLLFILGLTWVIASLGVYLRDIYQLIGIIVPTLMFMSPIFYPATALPEEYRWFLALNPLTTVIEAVRDLVFWGNGIGILTFCYYYIFAVLVAWLGFVFFQKTRKGFADVI